MLISLVKKDFILAKKELLILFISTIGVSILLNVQLRRTFIGKSFIFFVTALFIEYMLFNTVSTLEFKYKGSSLLCSTPYTRSTMVKARYLFMLISFLCVYFIYIFTLSFMNLSLTVLNISDFGTSFLTITAFFSIVIPFQYKFGFLKTRYISYIIVFATPFAAPAIINLLHANNIGLNISLPLSKMVLGMLLCLLAILIGYISMIISSKIYSRKNL